MCSPVQHCLTELSAGAMTPQRSRAAQSIFVLLSGCDICSFAQSTHAGPACECMLCAVAATHAWCACILAVREFATNSITIVKFIGMNMQTSRLSRLFGCEQVQAGTRHRRGTLHSCSPSTLTQRCAMLCSSQRPRFALCSSLGRCRNSHSRWTLLNRGFVRQVFSLCLQCVRAILCHGHSKDWHGLFHTCRGCAMRPALLHSSLPTCMVFAAQNKRGSVRSTAGRRAAPRAVQ